MTRSSIPHRVLLPAALAALALVVPPAPTARGESGAKRALVCMQPLGKYDQGLLTASERGVAYLYGFEVERLDPKPMPEKAWYAPRKRWRAEVILDWLDAKRNYPKRCTMVVGLTREDISTSAHGKKDWGILGLGAVGGRVGVVSSFRTHKRLEEPHTPARRTVKVVNHEIGHILGLPHLKGAQHPAGGGCLMNDAEGSVLTTDAENGLLCDSTVSFIERNLGYSLPRHASFDWSKVE